MIKFKFIQILLVIMVVTIFMSCSKQQQQQSTNEGDYLTKATTLLDSANNLKDDNLRNEALKLFQDFPNLYPNSEKVGFSYQKVAEIYLVQNKFEDCIKTLNVVTDKFKGKADGIKAQFQIGYIYFDNIKDLDKAKEAFQKLLSDYPASSTPDAGLTATADQMIKDLDIMKSGKSYEDIINERIGQSDKNSDKGKVSNPDENTVDKNVEKKKEEKKTETKKEDNKKVKTKDAPEKNN